MTWLWIVHRDSRRRAAIARLAAAPEEALLAPPGDPLLDSAPPPAVVVLGLAGDLESELEFAYRAARRAPQTGWLLLAEREDAARAEALFDTLDAEILVWPPAANDLRRRVDALRSRRGERPAPLSRRPLRQALADRFARWFGDLELPDLLRALDPRLADMTLLIRGEPGSGGELLARYVHAFGSASGGALVPVTCVPEASAAEIAAVVAAATRARWGRVTLWLDGVDRLAPRVQRELRGWIEYGPPQALAGAAVARWLANAGVDDARLDPDLRRVLGGLLIELPPLRARPDAIATITTETARAWCAARGQRPRRFEETALLALEEYPWPGNLRELEAVVVQTLAASAADPVRAGDLRLDGEAFAPVGAAEVEPLPPGEPPPDAPAPDDADEQGGELLAELLPDEEPLPDDLLAEPGDVEIAQAEPEPLAEILPEPAAPRTDPALRRLAGAVAHEVRNPLTAIRTFAELLPARHGDDEFRTRFAELVGRDVLRIEDVVERLARLAALDARERTRVDVAALLEELLERRRSTIRERRLLVLKELDAGQPWALADREQLGYAFEALLDQSLELVPERGDVYLASKHHPAGLGGEPSVRVLLRFHGPGGGSTAGLTGTAAADHALDYAIAELLVRAQGGAFAIDTTDAEETVIVLDLPA